MQKARDPLIGTGERPPNGGLSFLRLLAAPVSGEVPAAFSMGGDSSEYQQA
jgi:hypothetical protein